jgi:hypothetical protein
MDDSARLMPQISGFDLRPDQVAKNSINLRHGRASAAIESPSRSHRRRPAATSNVISSSRPAIGAVISSAPERPECGSDREYGV